MGSKNGTTKLFLATLGFLLIPMTALHAATFTVTNNDDSGAGSLRAAITDANASMAVADEIVFDGVTGTITLASSLPIITDALTITGPGSGMLTVDADGTGRVFHFDSTAGFQLLTITGLTITGGSVSGANGGGILSTSQDGLTLDDCVVTGNTVSNGLGAGLFFDGIGLTISNSTISNNNAMGASADGGGIYLNGFDASVSNTTISGNTAGKGGGGIFLNGNTIALNNVTVSGNSAAGDGGGINISGNTMTLSNVTITGNDAAGDGGGIHISGSTLILKNTILAGNTDSGDGSAPDCSVASITSEDHNIIGDDSGCDFDTMTNSTMNDQVNIIGNGSFTIDDILSTTLADNGGLTETHILVAGSPAIDAGNPGGCKDNMAVLLDKDQRGEDRKVGAACDVGAVEVGTCGDGKVDKANDEECDDGNDVDDDDCSNKCVDQSGNGGCSLITTTPPHHLTGIGLLVLTAGLLMAMRRRNTSRIRKYKTEV